MPLGQRAGDKSDSRYCGVETEFDDDMPHVLNHNLAGGFDFVLAPLVDPSYRPSLAKKDDNGTSVISFASSDLVLNPSQWSSHVVGKLSSWIDLDSDNEELRTDSEIALRQEISWASHLSLQACLLPPHRGGSCGDYARCVNQILQGINNMQLWLRVPLTKSELVGESSDPLMLISGTLVHNISQESFEVLPIDSDDDHFEGAPVKHSLKPYLEYVAYLYRRIDPLPEQERFELS